MTNDKTVTMSRELSLFESILGKKPDAFLHEPVYQVTESEVLEFARQLAAPAVERQEPVAWALLNGNGQVRDLTARWDVAKHWDGLVEALYTSPPAQVAVDIDEQQAFANWTHEVVEFEHADITRKVQRRDLMSVDDEKNAWSGWQARACLDKIKELNQ